jgi:beta-galactosidase
MAHIYGHSWPIRWGKEGEEKMIWVYSNCPEAELFVNGKSYGVKKRNSQDFPAAGLRWQLPLHKGSYQVKVVARKGKQTVTDEITFNYQSDTWSKPAQLLLEKTAANNDTVTVKVKLADAQKLICLDAKDYISFSIAGSGTLIDDQGTAGGSRRVQLVNGQAQISVRLNKGQSVVGATVQGVPDAFINL